MPFWALANKYRKVNYYVQESIEGHEVYRQRAGSSCILERERHLHAAADIPSTNDKNVFHDSVIIEK